jgi:predicted nucleic acid-binding protein
MIELPHRARVYADSNIWIYHVEGVRLWAEPIARFLNAVVAAEARLVTSELAWAECIYKPAGNDDDAAVETFNRFFNDGIVDIVAIDGADLMEAARQGGKLGLKLLDAVHFFAARISGCTHFATSDRRFRSTTDIETLVLSRDEPHP